MLPNRGVRCSIQHISIGRRRIAGVSGRQFSSVRYDITRGNPILPGRGTFTTSPRAWSSKTHGVVLGATAVRFASWGSWTSGPSSATTPPPPATNQTPIQTPSTTPTTFDETASSATDPLPTPPIPEAPFSVDSTGDFVTPLDNLDNFLVNASSISPDQIGYLQSLGIQYSRFRPTGLMEFVVEHIHVYSGTPWWATIALTAVAVRCVFFKVFVNAAENNTRMRAIMPITKPITEKMQAAAKARDQQGVMVHRSELQMIHKRAGVSIVKGFLPTLQFFPAMGTFFLLREMCKIPVPGLETGGILWFKDLTLQDPYFILPMAAATMLHLVLRKGGEAGNSTMDPSIQKAMMFGLPALSLAFTWWFPAAVQLSFAITSTISYGQVVAMANPTFRSFFNMTPVPPQTPTGPGSSSSSVSQSTTSTPSVLSQAELNSRFQGTSTPKKLFNEAKEGFEGTLKLAKEKMSESTEDRERKRVEDYEARRQKEIAQEKIRRTNQARSKRQSKFSKYTQK